MKMKNIFKSVLFFIGFLPSFLNAQSIEKNRLVLGLKYYNDNNLMQHLVVQAKSKIDGKFQKIENISVKVFINNEQDKKNLIGIYVYSSEIDNEE